MAPSGHGGGRVVTSTNALDGNGLGSFSIQGGRFLRGIEGCVEEHVNQSQLAQARLALTCMAALTRQRATCAANLLTHQGACCVSVRARLANGAKGGVWCKSLVWRAESGVVDCDGAGVGANPARPTHKRPCCTALHFMSKSRKTEKEPATDL